MNKEQFHKRVKEILTANRGPHNSPDKQFHDVMTKEAQGRSKNDWDEEVAAQVSKEFEWVTGTPHKSHEIPEDDIKALLEKFAYKPQQF